MPAHSQSPDLSDAPGRTTDTRWALEALEQSEARYRTLVENINDVLFSLDVDGRITYISPVVERFGFVPASDLVGQHFSRFVHPDDLPGLTERFRATLVGDPKPHEFRVLTPDGQIRYVRSSSRPLYEQGSLVGLTGLLTDVTERKLMEEELRLGRESLERCVRERTAALEEANARLRTEIVERAKAEKAARESEERWRRLVEHNPVCLAVHREGRIIYVNPACLRLFNVESVEDAIGRSILEFVHPDYRDVVVARVRETMARDVPAPPLEERFVRPDGSIIEVEVTAIPLTYMGERAIMTVIRDITHQREAERALRESEERYRRFFELDLSADYIARPDGTLVACNAEFVKLFGFASREEALATNVTELYPSPEAREEFLRLLRTRGTVVNHRMQLKRRDGKPLHVLANTTGVFGPTGELSLIQGFLLDETPMRLLEEQFLHAQKMEAVGRLAGSIAHDFNNMLTAVLGTAELILEKMPMDDPLRSRIETIRAAALRSKEVACRLLTFARKHPIEPRVIDLNASIAALRDVIQGLLGDRVAVRLDLADGLWPVRIDPTHVDHVLANLASNARDAIEGQGEVVIETANLHVREHAVGAPLEGNDWVRMRFTDTGRGMDEETKRFLFEPFFTTKPPGQGTGLGLFTVYGIVTQSGGFIHVTSEPGSGTTFDIFLPRAPQ